MTPETHRSSLCAAFMALLLAAVLSAQEPERWVEVRSAHFTVVSDANAKQAQDVAAEFEQFRGVFHAALPQARLDPHRPVVIVALKDEQSLRAWLPGFFEDPGRAKPSGVFVPGEEKHYAAIQLTAGPALRHNLYHEYVHLLNRLNFRGLPVWLNEGLAEFYANTAIQKDGAILGQPDEAHLQLLEQRRMLPLSALFAVDHASADYNEADRASLFYAQSWLLTHFLFMADEGAHRPQLEKLFALLAQGVAPGEASLQALAPLPELEQKLQAYIQPRAFRTVEIRAPAAAQESIFPARTLSPAEVKAFQGDFLLQTQRPVEARAALEEARRLDPRLPTVAEGLGRLALFEDKRSDAREWFGRAVAAGSRSFLAHYYYAMLVAEAAEHPEQVDDVERHLETAIELNPEFAPAYAALSGFYSARPEMLGKALELGRRAEQLDPEEFQYSLDVGAILLRMRRVDEAIALGEQVQARAVSIDDRRKAAAFLETARRYKQELADWKRAQQEAQAAGEARRKRQIEKSKELSQPAEPQAPSQPRWGQGAPQRVYGSGVEGWIAKVSCKEKRMDLRLDFAAYTLDLHSENYYEIRFDTRGWKPPDDFNPCVHLKGKRALIIYTALRGKPYAGEILSIEVRP